MDGRRFDNLTRAFASRGSRRAFVRSFVGLGGVAAVAAVDTDGADARTLRTRNTITTSPPAGCPGFAQFCGGECCEDSQTCCNQSCCSGTCENGVCCPVGTTNCGSHCCDVTAVCCGSICCSSAELCSASGMRCCAAGTSVCGEECCPAGWDCCDRECCDGTCFGEELCCPASREVCGSNPATCCEDGERCCGDVCAPAADVCCAGDSAVACGAGCCDANTQECCTDSSGGEHCVPIGGCCDAGQCNGDGECAGECNLTSYRCDFPGDETACDEASCSEDGTASIRHACDGAGQCVESQTDCDGFLCINGACTTSCAEDNQCSSLVCKEDGSCCAPRNVCIGEFCCESTPERPFDQCCPGQGACCDCFVDDRTNAAGFCYDPNSDAEVLCGDKVYLTQYYRCVNDVAVVKTYVCDDDVICPQPCCGGSGSYGSGPGGVCCPAGYECSNGNCEPAASSRSCNIETVGEDCQPNETCATYGDEEGNGHCCPSHRAFRHVLAEEAGAPAPYLACCSSDEQNLPSQEPGGHPYCSRYLELGTTSVKSWSRR